ncbi:MAG TPA: PQQ-binding-like beta-propeller repeat protein [Polyangiaceae bacterium]|nr:PQQ-binding-like beta-propeller repeat protein [Polyangiaceae bacterium]
MSAIEVVVRSPVAAPNPTALAPLAGFFDVIVDGVNITARLGAGPALALLVELAAATSGLSRGKRDRATVPFYADDDAWEIGLEADGTDVLVSVYRSGACPAVAVHERRVDLIALRSALLRALGEARADGASKGILAALVSAERELESPWPSFGRRPVQRRLLDVTSASKEAVVFAAQASFRCGSASTKPAAEGPALERADLHGLLLRGPFQLQARGRTLSVTPTYLFLLAEKLLMVADDVLDAWRSGRPVFRRIDVDGVKLSVRRGPGEDGVALTLKGPQSNEASEGSTLPSIDPRVLVRAAAGFALSLRDAFVGTDPAQAQNLRLSALDRTARALEGGLASAVAEDSLTNPEPDSYRSFGLPRVPRQRGIWDHGSKMRFVPRWVATVPNIDLRATFQCGDRILIGSPRETACLERHTGQVLWRVATERASSVITPLGLLRMRGDGQTSLHDLEHGEVKFTVQLRPRSAGGAAGAVVNAPGLPRLLVLCEGDRSVTALDLVSGDVRWRFSAPRPTSFRLRRAGKLLLVAGGDGALSALDVATGDVVWRLRDRLPFTGDIGIDHDGAFAVCGGPVGPARLHHVDLWSGVVRWTRELEERPAYGHAPLLTADTAVVPTRDRRGTGGLAFDRASGELTWEQEPGLASPVSVWLAVDDLLVVNSASGTLLGIEARTGTLRYNHVFPRHVDADQPRRLEPVLRNGALFVPQHQVHVVRPGDGEMLGTVPSDLIPDLLRIDEQCNVYIAEESGHVAAFGVAPRLTLVK